MAECYRCGQEGHTRAQCPQDAPQPAPKSHDGKVDWCGGCDKRTRLIYGENAARRCPTCHPLRHKPLPSLATLTHHTQEPA